MYVCGGGGGDNIIALDNNNYTDSTNLETDIWIGFTAKSNNSESIINALK